MCIINNIRSFARKGASVLRTASSREYNEESDIVRKFRNELYGHVSGRSTDAQNLMKDRRNVENDVRVSFNKIVFGVNG